MTGTAASVTPAPPSAVLPPKELPEGNINHDSISVVTMVFEVSARVQPSSSPEGLPWPREAIVTRTQWPNDRIDVAIGLGVKQGWLKSLTNGNLALTAAGVERAKQEQLARALSQSVDPPAEPTGPEKPPEAGPLTADEIEAGEPKLVRKCRALKPTLLPEIWLVLRAMVFAAYFTERDDEDEDAGEAVRRMIDQNPRRVQNLIHVADLCIELGKPEVAFKQAIKDLLRMNFISVSGWDESKFSFNGKAIDIATLARVILEEGHKRGEDYDGLRRVFDDVMTADRWPF